MTTKLSSRTGLLLLLLITAATRIPFIFDGYGVEEDSWGLVVNAYEMHTTGHYVASRFPGHPVEEYAYLLIYNQPAWVYNLLSVVMSMAAVGFFYGALKKMQLSGAFPAALAFCFVPVFFISGTYTIDFAWTIAFVMASFYFLLGRKFILSGILLGLATGCRVTSEVFLLPWVLLTWSRLDVRTWIKHSLQIIIPAAVIGILLYVPAYRNYGFAFFDYSDQFPYPPLAKVIYKATFGVFGLAGILTLFIFLFPAVRSWRKKELQPVTLFSSEKLLLACVLILVLHLISYLRLPQKSGYLVSTIPFVILVFALSLKEKQFRWFTIAFVLSPFLLSINLTDSLRGAGHSSLAVTFHASGQEIFLDPLSGPVFSERSKRLNKMAYCREISGYLDSEKPFPPRLIICGWWYNELLASYLRNAKFTGKLNTMNTIELRFYAECSVLDSAQKTGALIYYLPEQDLYNDQMYGQNCTDSLAQPFPLR